ncbi:hypothetical protein JCM8097_009049 [Rhodosporidiobolus ruineniae]
MAASGKTARRLFGWSQTLSVEGRTQIGVAYPVGASLAVRTRALVKACAKAGIVKFDNFSRRRSFLLVYLDCILSADLVSVVSANSVVSLISPVYLGHTTYAAYAYHFTVELKHINARSVYTLSVKEWRTTVRRSMPHIRDGKTRLKEKKQLPVPLIEECVKRGFVVIQEPISPSPDSPTSSFLDDFLVDSSSDNSTSIFTPTSRYGLISRDPPLFRYANAAEALTRFRSDLEHGYSHAVQCEISVEAPGFKPLVGYGGSSLNLAWANFVQLGVRKGYFVKGLELLQLFPEHVKRSSHSLSYHELLAFYSSSSSAVGDSPDLSTSVDLAEVEPVEPVESVESVETPSSDELDAELAELAAIEALLEPSVEVDESDKSAFNAQLGVEATTGSPGDEGETAESTPARVEVEQEEQVEVDSVAVERPAVARIEAQGDDATKVGIDSRVEEEPVGELEEEMKPERVQ